VEHWDERQYEMYPPALKSPYGERRSAFGKERYSALALRARTGRRASGSKKSAKREMRVVQYDSGLAHENPCAQCAKPIAAPEWTAPHLLSLALPGLRLRVRGGGILRYFAPEPGSARRLCRSGLG
jgi:hypothetical protein